MCRGSHSRIELVVGSSRLSLILTHDQFLDDERFACVRERYFQTNNWWNKSGVFKRLGYSLFPILSGKIGKIGFLFCLLV